MQFFDVPWFGYFLDSLHLVLCWPPFVIAISKVSNFICNEHTFFFFQLQKFSISVKHLPGSVNANYGFSL